MNYSKSQRYALLALRLLIGWHFLYEGLLKVFTPAWTSKGYLLGAQGLFKPLFAWLASDALIGVVDILTVVGLVVAGLSLLLGFYARLGALAGMILLAFFYLSYPPFPGIGSGPTEGNYFLVNKNLIELGALLVLYWFPTSHLIGLDSYRNRRRNAALEIS